MTVYGDILIAENIITGGVLIYLTALVCRRSVSGKFFLLRYAAGCVMCGLFSLTIFLPGNMILRLLMEAVFALMLCGVVFGFNGIVKKAFVFVLVTYLMGGMTMGLLLLSQSNGIYSGTGIYTGDMKAGILALFTAMFTAAVKKAVSLAEKRRFSDEYVFDMEIVSGGKTVSARGFVDTGNSLKDPVCGRPVAIADQAVWHDMESAGMVQDTKLRMIPYETVGAEGVLYGVAVDLMRLHEKARDAGTSGSVTDIRGCVIVCGRDSFRHDCFTERRCGVLLPAYIKTYTE